MDNEISFSDILEEFLIVKGLSQTAFAQMVGIKQSQVSEWLKGKAKPGYDMLKRITMTFNISADFWLGLSDKME